jgi:hypothetical protein
MATTVRSPGFITHHELDRLAGTARTRQRWQRQGFVPAATWVRADRARVGLLPEFVLGSVVTGAPKHATDAGLLRQAGRLAEEVCSTESFRELIRGAQDVLAEMTEQQRSWSLGYFVDRLADYAGTALAAWRRDADTAERELRREGLSVVCQPAKVQHVDGCEISVSADGGVNSWHYRVDELGWVPEAGRPVVIDRLEVGTRRRDFVLPSVTLEDGMASSALRASSAGASSARGDSMNGTTAVRQAPGARLSPRLAAIAERARTPTPLLSNARQQVNWRAQFDRGYLGASWRLGATVQLSKGAPTRTLSRPLEWPLFG